MLEWEFDLEPRTGISVATQMRMVPTVRSATIPAGVLYFSDPRSGEGDSYPTEPIVVTQAWPFDVSYALPLVWAAEAEVTTTVTATNVAGQPLGGTLTLDLAGLDGAPRWSSRKAIDVPAGDSRASTFVLTAPSDAGFYQLTGKIAVDGRERTVVDEIVSVRRETYLPYLAQTPP